MRPCTQKHPRRRIPRHRSALVLSAGLPGNPANVAAVLEAALGSKTAETSETQSSIIRGRTECRPAEDLEMRNRLHRLYK